MASSIASPSGSASNSPRMNGTRSGRQPHSSLREVRTAPSSENGDSAAVTREEMSAPPSPHLAKPLPLPPLPRGLQLAASRSSPSLAVQNNTLGKPHMPKHPNLEAHLSSSSSSSSSQPSLRQLALASSVSSPLIPPLPTAKSVLLTQNPNPSENWTAPEDADGAYIRKTYDWFDQHGVTGDGLVEGREWTRERGKRAVWQQSMRQRPVSSVGAEARRKRINDNRPVSSSASTASHKSPFPTGSAMKAVIGSDGKLTPTLPSPQAQLENSQARDHQAPNGRASPSAHSHMEELNSPTQASGSSPTMPTMARVPSSSTIASHSDESAYSGEGSQRGTIRSTLRPEEEARHQTMLEESERVRAEMLRKIDRYGFFARDEGDIMGKGRITILTDRAFSSLPKRRLLIGHVPQNTMTSGRNIRTRRISRSGGNAGAFNGVGLGASASFVVTPGLSTNVDSAPEDAGQVADGARSGPIDQLQDNDTRVYRLISSQRSSNAYAARPKESTRVAKWADMLTVEGARAASSSSEDNQHNDEKSFNYELSDKATRTEARRRRLQSRVYKGIPDRWRAAAWWALISNNERVLAVATKRKERNGGAANSSSAGPNLSSSVETKQADAHPSTLFDAVTDYVQLTEQPSTHDVQIDLDVPRTISGHYLFHTRYGQGQRSLFHVLHAFSLLCPQCGYCQGMGPIAATLLVYLPPERAYAALVHLHDYTPPAKASASSSPTSFTFSTAEGGSKYGLHETFSPGFPGLGENFYVQRALCPLLGLGPVLEILDEQMISTSAYATKWYITLFANVVSFETQLRIWDAFVCVGKDVLVGVALALLWALRNRIMGREKIAAGGKTSWDDRHPFSSSSKMGNGAEKGGGGGASFETILEALTAEFLLQDDDGLMRWVEKLLTRDDVIRGIAKARKEYRTLVEQGKQPMML